MIRLFLVKAFILLNILPTFIFGMSDKNINYIRKQFYAAIESEEVTESLISFIENIYSTDENTYSPQILAYKGGLDALLAKHAFNPFNKFKYIIKALSKLDKAVESSPYSLETRFIRFSVLHNLPGVFDIDEKRQEDLKIIITLLLKENYTDIDKSLQKGIAEFMLESKRLNEYQIIQLKKLMSNLAFNE